MIAVLLVMLLVRLGPPPPPPIPQPPIGPFVGYAAHYNVDRMERTSAIRKMPLVPCMVATDLVPLGFEVDVLSRLTGETKRCRATDLSKDEDRGRHLRNRLYIEFDWPSGAAMCQLQYVGQKAWRDCPVIVWIVRYPTGKWKPPVAVDRDIHPQRSPNWTPPRRLPSERHPRITRQNIPACRDRHEARFEPVCGMRERVERRRHQGTKAPR